MDDNGFPLTAGFLRGLAATVAGRPEGPRNYYMVGCLLRGREKLVFGPSMIPRLFETRAEAEEAARACAAEEKELGLKGKGSDAKFAVLGPFLSPDDPAQPHDVVVSGILSRRGNVPGSRHVKWKVEKSMDLLCFSPSAFDKFIAPYYYALYGSGQKASAQVERLKEDMIKSDSGIMGHRWPTSPGFIEAEFTMLADSVPVEPQDENYQKQEPDKG